MPLAIALPLPNNGSYQTQWDYLLSSFEPDELYVIGDEEEAPSTNVFSHLEATYITTLGDLPGDPTVVLLASLDGRYIQGDESLVDFTHPDDAIYFFGHDTRWVSDEVYGGRTPDHFVYIPTDSTDDLWSWMAAGIVLWDRMMKSG